ncbi:hypothetical protein O9992_05460 [Vibrio lentus]|nr:hypothetical protein [Vibrio lentus]
MAAPGGLSFKIIKPETDTPDDNIADEMDRAMTNQLTLSTRQRSGASVGLQPALNVGAMLLAFIGLIALINGILGGIGEIWFGTMEHLTLELLLGWIFAPLAFIVVFHGRSNYRWFFHWSEDSC